MPQIEVYLCVFSAHNQTAVPSGSGLVTFCLINCLNCGEYIFPVIIVRHVNPCCFRFLKYSDHIALFTVYNTSSADIVFFCEIIRFSTKL